MVFDVLNKVIIESLPAHELSKHLEASKLDDALRTCVEVVVLGVFLVENVGLCQAVDNFNCVTEIIFWVTHFKYRLKNVGASGQVKVEIAGDQDLIFFGLDIDVDFIA